MDGLELDTNACEHPLDCQSHVDAQLLGGGFEVVGQLGIHAVAHAVADAAGSDDIAGILQQGPGLGWIIGIGGQAGVGPV